ncbi:hypothetical protein D3C81_375500 [compost metagenome]
MATTQKQQITPAMAAQNFAQATRQNMQMLPAIAGAESSTISFNLPKVRLTSKVRVMVEATVNVKHASATIYTPPAFGPYALIRKVGIEVQNGFRPFNVSGEELQMMNYLDNDSQIYVPQTSGRGKVVQGVAASAAGVDNVIRFPLELPFTLNDRDPIGMILTQNQETTVSVTIDTNAVTSLLANTSGYTVVLKSLTFTPMVESFTIPASELAFPDLSILKMVQSSRQSIAGAGEQTIKLPTGQTYRRIAIYLDNGSGVGLDDSAITGNFEVLFNQADTPYKVSPKQLAAINHEQYGRPLPNGLYAFDFTYQGFANFGGSRDYVDTQRLTEFWIKFVAPAAGNVTVVYETLSQMQGA